MRASRLHRPARRRCASRSSSTASVDGMVLRFAGSVRNVRRRVCRRHRKRNRARWAVLEARPRGRRRDDRDRGPGARGARRRDAAHPAHLAPGRGRAADLASPASALARATGIGAAGACNVDVACVTPADAAANDLAKSVARITFVGPTDARISARPRSSTTRSQSNTPYLWTADHCLPSAGGRAHAQHVTASSRRRACNNKATPPFVQLGGGAKLLGRSQDNDWSIVRLNERRPAGTRFAAWRARAARERNAGRVAASPRGRSPEVQQWRGDAASPASTTKFVNGTLHRSRLERRASPRPAPAAARSPRSAPSGAFYEVRGGLFGGALGVHGAARAGLLLALRVQRCR